MDEEGGHDLATLVSTGLTQSSPIRPVQGVVQPRAEDGKISSPSQFLTTAATARSPRSPRPTRGYEVIEKVGVSLTAEKKIGLGWKSIPFIFGGELGERVAAFGIQLNLINFLILNMNMSLVSAANTVTNFFGTACISTLGGAFLADAYIGCFWTITGGCVFYLAGLSVLTLLASMPRLQPAPCSRFQMFQGKCEKASSVQIAVLYISLVLQCIGSGGLRPCTAPFGADQFNKSDKNHSHELRHYFNWYYMCIAISLLLSVTLTVYLQDEFGWGWGTGACLACMIVGTASFLRGAPLYRYLPALGSPLTRMAQVLVAALRKYKHILPDNPDYLHEARKYQENTESLREVEILSHTENIRFLDRAAIMEDVDDEPDTKRRLNPWRLSTVHQVEELKILVRIAPVWLCSAVAATVFVQSGTFSVRQAGSMDNSLGNFQIPAASMGVFGILALTTFIPLYDLVLIKMLRKLTGHPRGLTYLQRIGVGLVLSMVAMIVAALVEVKRRRVAHRVGMIDQMMGTFLPISGFWLVPQFVLLGLAETFVIIGQIEFFYDEAPMSIRSMSNSFVSVALGVGSFLSSAIVQIIQSITQQRGQGGWLQNNINRGHLDRYYWFLAVISCFNIAIFYCISRWYIYKNRHIYDTDSSPQTENSSSDTKSQQ